MGEIIEDAESQISKQKTEDRRQMTDVKNSAKSTSQWRFCMLPGLFYSCRECSTNRPIILQNKANFKNDQMDIKLNKTRDYENKLHWTLGENKAKQSQSFDFAQSTGLLSEDRSSEYPCVFELAVYNLVVRDGNGRNFYGEFIKWQMDSTGSPQEHRKQMQ